MDDSVKVTRVFKEVTVKLGCRGVLLDAFLLAGIAAIIKYIIWG